LVRSVLFVCLGNICRSPLAEAALRAEAERIGLEVEVESAGTGDWHLGYPPDPRAVAVAERNGIDLSGKKARQVTPEDFRRFDHILALDLQNLRNLKAMQPAGAKARLSLLLDHVPGREGQPVADPYYGDDSHFDETWRDVTQGARALARELKEQGD
jgi:protein-tyrosine phosphatase